LASFGATASPGDDALSVAWRYDDHGDVATALRLDLYQIVNGERRSTASATVTRVLQPDAYTIPVGPGAWLVQATPRNDVGWAPPTDSSVVSISNACFSASICARVSTSSAATTVRLAGQGFLHNLGNPADVSALKPKQWRFAGNNYDAAAQHLGVSRTQILSDLWTMWTSATNGGYARTPWSDWSAWQAFVRNAVLTTKSAGASPDYWEVWNEPNGLCCPRFSPADLTTVTVDRWFQTYEIAWKAIKAADPTAKLIGPSLSYLQWAPGGAHEFDLETFLTYSAAHGLTWDAISWHENNSAPLWADMVPLSNGYTVASVSNLDRHIATARAVIARHPRTVVDNTMFVNEYGPADTHMLAGWTVGYLRAFENGGVAEANHTCWTDAECHTELNGLLDSTGQPTALWWAHKFYADLGGATRMSVNSSSSWQFDGLATRDDPTGTVRVLLGRHASCNKSVNAWCGFDPGIAPASVAVTIDWPYGAAPVKITTSRMPAGAGPLPAPTPLGSTIMQPVAGTLTVFVPAVSDGDALSIVANPA
jgi:hypothetical protein